MANSNRLSPLDAAFLYLERPHQLMHVGCVALLDGPIPFDRFAVAMAERVGRIRRYRQRPVRPFLDLTWPRWEDDAAFDVRRHLRHVAVPAPGGEDEVHRLVDTLFATPLDDRRPLWETYLVDGLAGGRAAILCKVHHAMIDGVSGAQVLEAMADPVPVAADARPRPQGAAPALPSALAALSPQALLATARDAVEAASTFGSMIVQPSSTLPFNGPITDARRIVWASFALDDFLAIRGTVGCKVNDVVLAVIAGALRRYLHAKGVRSDGLRVRTLVPVSVRRPEDHMSLGNLVTSMFPTLPIDVADPIARLTRMSDEMGRLKERGQPRATALTMQLMGLLPAPVNAFLARILPDGSPLNTVCTNIPGPREPRQILGRQITEVHPIVPLFSGMGLEFAILSYAGRISISAAAEANLVPDAAEIPGHLHASLQELRDALGIETGPRPEIAAAGPLVGELMRSRVVTIGPGESLATAYHLMRTHRIRHLPVTTEQGRLIGLVSHRDLLAATSSSLLMNEEKRVRLLGLARVVDVMETHVVVANASAPAAESGERMIRHKIGCLPVVEAEERLVGIVTEEDFLRWATTHMAPAAPLRATA
ncbi:MAG TPA: wax ester/triacylglycerol synthase family O-acyltransferase [Candidatus Eisenbacteria bacterium]|nr:wax ester/triacylglycerol synthase family O-acyltransferase [Candidatus Eisenbacteria bacterium]